MKLIRKYSVPLLVLLFVSVATVAVTQTATKKQSITVAEKTGEPPADSEVPTADDPWKEVENVVAAYYKKGGMYYKGTIKVVDDNGEKEVILEENLFEYTVYNNDYHYRLGNLEMVSTADLLLAVSHEAKTVAFSPKTSDVADNQLFNLLGFRQAMLDKGAEAKVTQSGGEKILTFDKIQDPSIQGYRIYYKPDTYQVTRMELGMLRYAPLETAEVEEAKPEASAGETATPESSNEAELETYTYMVEVLYSEIRPLGLGRFTPENKFIERVNGTIQLTAPFKDYTLSGGE